MEPQEQDGPITPCGRGAAIRRRAAEAAAELAAIPHQSAAEPEGAQSPTRSVSPKAPDSKKPNFTSKQGSSGDKTQFLANYYQLRRIINDGKDLKLFSIQFNPELTSYMMRRKFFDQMDVDMKQVFGVYVYDGGHMLYSYGGEAGEEDVNCNVELEPGTVQEIRLIPLGVAEDQKRHWARVYNLLLKQTLYMMGYLRIQDNFFDASQAKTMCEGKVKILPGVSTSVRKHDMGLLLNVDTISKVIRLTSVLMKMEEIKADRNTKNFRRRVEEEIVGSIVMTRYNSRTYPVAEINWDATPLDTFDQNGTLINYVEYSRSRHGATVTSLDQPLLLAAPSKRDYHRTPEAEEVKKVYLLPEFCQLVGLSDEMRSDFLLMKQMTSVLHPSPEDKLKAIKAFRQKIDEIPEVKALWKSWGCLVGNELITIPGRTYKNTQEKIKFRNDREVVPTAGKAEWNNAFRTEKVYVGSEIKVWSIVYPGQRDEDVRKMVMELRQVANALGVKFSEPRYVPLRGNQSNDYYNSINKVCEIDNDLVFVVLPGNKSDIYASVKHQLTIEKGVPSQCYQARNLAAKGLKSILTKVAVQVNSKLGGESWLTPVPLKGTMVVGHARQKFKKNGHICTMTATLSKTSARYFNCASHLKAGEHVGDVFGRDMRNCLMAYNTENGDLPGRIFLYIEGYSEGELASVKKFAIPELKKSIESCYTSQEPIPKLSVVVVNRNPGIRIFQSSRSGIDNPMPGSIVDDAITLPEFHDFYLVPQHVRQGAVTPTSFVVLHDEQDLDIDKIQRLSFKFCHAYFNCFSTVALPAPCQYAKRLAAQLVTIGSVDFCASLASGLFYL